MSFPCISCEDIAIARILQKADFPVWLHRRVIWIERKKAPNKMGKLFGARALRSRREMKNRLLVVEVFVACQCRVFFSLLWVLNLVFTVCYSILPSSPIRHSLYLHCLAFFSGCLHHPSDVELSFVEFVLSTSSCRSIRGFDLGTHEM